MIKKLVFELFIGKLMLKNGDQMCKIREISDIHIYVLNASAIFRGK